MQRLCALFLFLATSLCIVAPAHAQKRNSRSATSKTVAARSTTRAIRNIFWQPNTLVQGSPVFFTVELEQPATRVSATWAGKTLSFFSTGDHKVWYALAGDDIETQPGTYNINVTAALANGRVARSEKPIDIGAGDFKTGAIDVPENFVEPGPEDKKQIARDTLLKARAFAHSATQPLWSGDFKPPVSAAPTQSFGESRILNEEKTSTHRGTDYPVNEGTPVLASNAGVVVVADSLFYEGNCVIVDHGGKLYTIYMHLSKMNVKAGDHVAKGEKLGLSGATGRVTGPHVHIGVRWNGSSLDPVQFFKLTLPQTGAHETKTAAVARRRTTR